MDTQECVKSWPLKHRTDGNSFIFLNNGSIEFVLCLIPLIFMWSILKISNDTLSSCNFILFLFVFRLVACWSYLSKFDYCTICILPIGWTFLKLLCPLSISLRYFYAFSNCCKLVFFNPRSEWVIIFRYLYLFNNNFFHRESRFYLLS